MRKGLVRIAAYPGEFLAQNARQFLVDSGIAAEVFTGGIIAALEQFDVFVPAEKAAEARELLKEFEEEGAGADEQGQSEDEDEHPEADCEDKS
jgi:hypothetical protein